MATDLLKPLSKLNDVDKLIMSKDMRYQSYYADVDWVQEAQLAEAFKSGHQWTDNETAALAEQGRETMVFNYIHSTIELLVGVLTQNPIMIRINPVEKNDGFLAEVMSSLVDWVEENQTEAEVLDTEAFEDSVTTGKGYRSIDIQPRPENPTEILFVEDTVPFWQVRVDPGSRKQDLSDARYVITEKWVSLEDFKIRYPEHVDKIEEIFAASGENLQTEYSNYDYLDPSIETIFDDYSDGFVDYYDVKNLRVLVCQLEYFEMYNRFYLIDPENPAETREIAEKQAKLFPENEIIKVAAKKIHWLHFTNDFILYDAPSPIDEDGYSTVPMFAYADKSKRIIQYFGIVKPMIDPQRECNRRWMQAMRLMKNQGTGVYAEADAFVDLDQAQESWADPEEITLVNTGKMGAIQEKTALDFPAASIKMQEVSKDSMKQITGINPDMMGIREKQEPGIVIKLRQQQGMTIISKLFRNYKRMKKRLYKIRVKLVSKYMPDWQIAKILGETDRYVIKDGMVIDKKHGNVAPIRAVRDMKYNLKYEDAPGNMTKMMSELAIFMDMVTKGFPVDPMVIIDKLDINETAKEDWKEYVKKGQASQEKNQQGMIQAKQAEAQGKVQSEQAKLQIDNGKLQIENQKLQLSNMKMQTDNQFEAQKIQIAGMKVQSDTELKAKELQIEELKNQTDALAKRQENMLKYMQFKEDKAENQRQWVLALSDDERNNLDQDLRTLGIVNKEIETNTTTN